VLDELFDDPVLIKGGPKRKGNREDFDMDFAKSKKGLGDLYQDDL
jgi:hypothetical protein